jgi:hypothetical protein
MVYQNRGRKTPMYVEPVVCVSQHRAGYAYYVMDRSTGRQLTSSFNTPGEAFKAASDLVSVARKPIDDAGIVRL